jgi:hypothetical protein
MRKCCPTIMRKEILKTFKRYMKNYYIKVALILMKQFKKLIKVNLEMFNCRKAKI